MTPAILYCLSAFVGGVASAIWTRLVLARRRRVVVGDEVRVDGTWYRVTGNNAHHDSIRAVSLHGGYWEFNIGLSAIEDQRRPRP